LNNCVVPFAFVAAACSRQTYAFVARKTNARILTKPASSRREAVPPAEEGPSAPTYDGETPADSVSRAMLTEKELSAVKSSPMFLSSSSDAKAKNYLSPEEFINIAKRFLVKSKGIGGDADLLSENFVFEAPVVGPFGKEQFLDATGRVDFELGFPDWKGEFYNFQVDVFEPNKVWYMAKGEGTNSGPFPTKDLPATYKKVVNPPQICSLTVDPDTGLIARYTIGYVADRSAGNTGGLGGLYGILYAIGRPLPFPEALPWKPSFPYIAFQKIGGLLNKLQG